MADKRHASKRLIGTGVGVGLLLGGASGLALTLPTGAFAQDDTSAAQPAPDARGGAHGGPMAGPMAGPMRGVLDDLVASGTITQEQADAIVAAAEARRDDARRDGTGSDGVRQARGPRHGGPGRPGGPGASLETAAEAIGISVEDLRTQLRDGQSLAAIAEANGVNAESLVDALTADARQRITEMIQRVPGERPGS